MIEADLVIEAMHSCWGQQMAVDRNDAQAVKERTRRGNDKAPAA
jgi:hypothetical protein